MPRTVKDLLVEIKDTSELMVDLAYSAILYDNEDIAEEVLELEARVNELLKQIRVVSILAARRIEEAEKVATILQVANAGQKISSAAADISTLVLRGYKLSKDIVNLILYHSEETVVKVEVPEDSEIAGKTLGEAHLHTRTGMRVIAVKRGFNWLFDPNRDTRILKGDVLFARGDPAMLPVFYEVVANKKLGELKKPEEIELEELDRAVDMLIEMKNLSELAVDLAYSSLLYNNEELALEVSYLEENIDNMKFEVERLVLESSKKFEDLQSLVAIVEIAHCSEQIADAAREIAVVLLDRAEIPEIFKEAMRKTDEVIVMLNVDEKSPIAGKTLGEAKVETNTGMHVVAVKRGNSWITKPTASTKILPGDIIIAKGTREGEKALLELCQ
ncbi:MAG: TrkA C-terminal domain-containing protein [Archaeoglobaceae archaeon]